MAWNPNDEVSRGRLFKSLEHSYKNLEWARNFVAGIVAEYAGSGFGSGAKQKHEILINLLNQAATAATISLVANRPRVKLTTENPGLRPFSKQFELAINNLIKEIGLENVLRKWVLDAFFCVGIVKVHMADSGQVQLEQDLWMDPGTPFASNVALENWVHDVSATSWEKMQFAGDWYRLPLAEVQESPIYDQAEAAKLVATTKYANEGERLEEIARGAITDQDELEPMVDLCDIWIPKDGVIYTFALDGGGHFRPKGLPLAQMVWDGPEFGPYKKLAFHDVPENIMPASPASQISGLARLANNLVRKQARKAHRQKDNPIYTPAGTAGAQNAKKASDGEWVQVEDVTQIGQVKQGGIDAATQQFLDWVLAAEDRMAGNVTAKLGLGAQATTVGQEQLIHGAAAGIEGHMAYRVTEATVSLVRDLAHLLWNDRFKTIPARLEIPGADGYSIDASWTPDDREGSFIDYQFNIDIYSMPYLSPQQRAANLDRLVSKYANLGPLLMSQGGTINMQKLVELDAELLNEPRVKELIQFVGAPIEGDGEEPPMPTSTSREYVRRSESDQSPQAQSVESQANWAQLASQQQSEATAA